MKAKNAKNMKREDPVELIDAGGVAVSPLRYRVTWPHKHPSLRIGDVVVMTETPRHENLLLRLEDTTLHVLADENGQYVHLIEDADL